MSAVFDVDKVVAESQAMRREAEQMRERCRQTSEALRQSSRRRWAMMVTADRRHAWRPPES